MFHSIQKHLEEPHHPRSNWAEERKKKLKMQGYLLSRLDTDRKKTLWRRRISEGFVHGPDLFLAKE
jgi:hypothetical protein